MIKIGNWWFPDNDINRHDQSDCQWGEYRSNQGIIDFVEEKFNNKDRNHALDIGANIGFMTAYFGSKWKKVTSFEPTPSTFDCLKKNCSRSNIVLKNLALSDLEGELLFAVGGKSEINQIISDKKYLKKHWSSIIVPAASLDSLNLQEVDVIKIDVEGHELSVIKGAEKTIKQSRPLIIIEISFENKILDKEISHNHEHALTLLESWGYKKVQRYRYDWILEYENN
jgi:FkbM family methyltransferase